MTLAQIKKNIKHGDYSILQKLLRLSTESAARQKFLRGDKDALEGMIKIQENRSIFCDLHADEDCSCHEDLKEAINQKADINHTHDWNEITGKPTEFPPTHHLHDVRDIEGLDDVLHTIDEIRNLSNQKLDKDGSNATGSLASTINNNHNHVNKAVLDTITASKVNDWDNAAGKAHNAVTLGSNATGLTITNQVLQFSNGYQLPTTIKISEWDDAYLKRHTHGNKAVLDNLTQSVIDQSHAHSNKSVIDGITAQMINNWNASFANNHTHNNKVILDGISSADVTNWDTAHANNHSHTNKVILDAITAAYTAAEKNKLATIQPNAQVNVKADWNATSGDAEILNKPISFTPSSHNHAISDVAGLQSELNSKLEANDLDGFVYNVIYNSTNHKITFYSQNKANVVIDLPIEQLITGVELVGNDLMFTFEDESVVSVPLNTLLVGVVKSVNGTVPNSNGEIVVNLSDIPNLSSELANKLDVRMNGLVNNLTQAEKNSIYSKLSIVNNIIQTLGISGNTITLSNSGGSVTVPHTDWVNIPNKPTSFTPSSHNHPSSQINTLTGYVIGTNATISSTDTLNTALGKIQAQINAKTPNLGTVTSVQTGTGLTGGTITNAGTISLNSSTTASLLLADSALQSGDSISDLVNDAGYITISNLPAVGNGALSMTMPIGLNVTGGFTANQSANSSFDLTYANGYQGYTTAECNKLAGIQLNANNYVLPIASNTVSGGIKVGANLSIDTNGVLNSSYINTTYSAGNGLTLSGSVFSLPITQTGTGNAVTALTQTANGVTVTKGATFLTGFTETDPTVPNHVKAITAANVLDWNSKQPALTNGLHTVLNANKTDVAFDVNTYVKDKANNDRLLFGSTQADDTVIKLGAISGDFSVRNKAGLNLFRISGSSGVPYFPQISGLQTGTGNLAFFDSGNGLWKHQLNISDLITTSNIGTYIFPQNLSMGTQTGQIDISQGGTSTRLTSLYTNSSVNDWNVNPLSSSGLFVINNNVNSVNYPTTDAGGGIGYFRGANPQGSFQLWTPTTNTDKVYLRTGASTNAFNTPKIIATEEWIATQNFAVGNLTNCLSLLTNTVGTAGGISTDVNLQTNSIVYAGGNAPNRPNNTNSTIFSMRGLSGYGGQIATRAGLWWLRNLENGTHGNWETIATRDWATANFANLSSLANFWTTNTPQTGLTGDKTTSGRLTLDNPTATALIVRRNSVAGNSTMRFEEQNSLGFNIGLATGANMFAVGYDANLASVNSRWFSITDSATSENGAKLKAFGGTGLQARDTGGYAVDTATNSNRAEMVVRHKWSANNLTFAIGGIGSGTSGSMAQWGMYRWLNDRTVNGTDGFFGWTGNTDLLRASSFEGGVDKVIYANTAGHLLSRPMSDFALSSSIPAQVNVTQGTGIAVSGTYPNLTIANSAPNIIQTLSHSGNTVTLSNGGGSFTLPTTTTYTAGTGLSLTGTTFGQTITTSGTGTFVTGITQTANGFQVNLGTPPNTVYTAGTGISVTSNVITNSAPNATHTGDVTGSTALTIATSAVTHAKYQNIATQTFLGRVSTGTGNVEALTVAQMKSALGIPTVNNGTLNLSVGVGLTGSATFTANQAGVSGFTVGIDSGYVLPTTAQWNNKQNALTAGTGISIIGNTISATGNGGSGITKIFTDNSQQSGPTASQVPIKFTSHEAYGLPEADNKDGEHGNLTIKVETGDVVRWHGSFDSTFTVTPAVGSTYDLDIDGLRRHIYNVVFIGGVGASTVKFGKGLYEGDQINITVPRGQQINLSPQGVGIISSFGREVQTHANLIWSTREQQWVLVSYN